MIRRISLILLTAVMLFSLAAAALPAAAADTVTTTVNIATANKNVRGPGYDWANRYDILTLDGLNIDTSDAYGLRLPKNCTVVLKGNNTIKAAKYGVSCSGTVVFKGSGKLTIEAGEIGIYLIAQDSTQKVRLIEGKYEITAGTYGIYSDASDFSFVGESMSVKVADENGAAVSGRAVNLLGGSFSANAPVESTHQLLVDGLKIDVDANRAAFSSKNLTVKNLSLAGEYAGESSVHAKSTRKEVRDSILFGESVPGWVDYILLLAATAGIAAAVVVPVLRKKKKREELYKRLAEEGYDIIK
ncbi:MAG: hypothetical protein IJC71_08490 [Clostridia bacterium]|nr:hypothetical protein [Clostridia bacterium]